MLQIEIKDFISLENNLHPRIAVKTVTQISNLRLSIEI